jgi:two-component system NtrC family response regulator
MMPKPRIVIIDDEEPQTRSFAKQFCDEFDIVQINVPEKVIGTLDRAVSVAVVDECMGAVSGITLLCELKIRHPDIIRILITGYGDEKLPFAVNNARIFHYVQKPFNTDELRAVLHEAVREFRVRQWGQEQLRRFEQERDMLTARPAGRAALRETLGLSAIVGNSKAIGELIEKARKAVNQTISILIDGETGTGKDILARAIHNEGTRPHIRAINCALLANEGLARAELFGVAKGAFTDAIARPGLCELADKGTLFLDEIAELPLGVQPMLLTFLDRGEFTRVGSNTVMTTEVRVIAATNKNLKEEVAARRFREDLYFRLKRFQITLPPLRERCEDIPLLADYFLRIATTELGRTVTLTEAASGILCRYGFPGNIRELQSVIQSASVECDGLIEPRHLPMDVRTASSLPENFSLSQRRDDYECDQIRQAVASTKTQEEAAAKLGMSARWLRKRLKDCGELT